MLSCVGGCCMCLRLGAHELTQSQHAHMYIIHSTTIYDNIYILTESVLRMQESRLTCVKCALSAHQTSLRLS